MRQLALFALCLMLAACQTGTPDARYLGPPDRIDLSSCGGEPILDLIGQNVSTMPATGGWATLRVIKPGMAVTEDYSITRLNVTVDDQDLITGATCG
jgi:hypothetical protein